MAFLKALGYTLGIVAIATAIGLLILAFSALLVILPYVIVVALGILLVYTVIRENQDKQDDTIEK